VALLSAAPPLTRAQTEDQPLVFVVTGLLSTGGELLPDPSAPSTLLRQKPPAFSTGFGYGAEVRYRFPSTSVAVGLSIDHSAASIASTIRSSSGSLYQSYPIEDGYRAFAVELTGYFFIPVGGPSLGLFMGGGAGGYWGERVFRLAGIEAGTTETKPGFGIHVLGGASYTVFRHVGLTFTMKFRDLQFESTSTFAEGRIPYGSSSIYVGTAPFTARVQANSVLFTLGIMFAL